MFIIFGWGKVTVRDHGATVPATCANCHNQGMQNYVHARTWITLFFIPVIPYKSQHLLLCPVCERGVKVTAAQGARAEEMITSTAQWRLGELDETAYLDQVSAFWNDVNPPASDPTRAIAPTEAPAETPAESEAPTE